MKRLKWHGVLFSLFLLFLYIMGMYDFFMMLSHNAAYYLSKGYGEAVHHYFTNYPLPGLILWIGNLVSGLAAPILYLWKKNCACQVAYASFLFDLCLILFGAIFRNRFNVFDRTIIFFDLAVLVITLLFGVYLHFQAKRAEGMGKA